MAVKLKAVMIARMQGNPATQNGGLDREDGLKIWTQIMDRQDQADTPG